MCSDAGEIWAQVQDDVEVRWAWAVVYPPSWEPPPPGDELAAEPPPLTLQPRGLDWYAGLYAGLDEVGMYRIVVYAEDQDGQSARPKELQVQGCWPMHLPLVIHRY